MDNEHISLLGDVFLFVFSQMRVPLSVLHNMPLQFRLPDDILF